MNINIWRCDSKKGFPRSIGAWFIRKFQGTPYTHYCVEVADEFFDAALISGVAHSNKDEFFKRYDLHGDCWSIPIERFSEFQSFHSRHEGKKYGLMQAIGIGLKWTLRWASNPFGNGSNKLICNEYALRCLEWFTTAELESVDDISLKETEELLDMYIGEPYVVSKSNA